MPVGVPSSRVVVQAWVGGPPITSTPAPTSVGTKFARGRPTWSTDRLRPIAPRGKS